MDGSTAEKTVTAPIAEALARGERYPEHERITVTPAAAAHIRKMVDKAQALGLRIGTKKSGCSGWMYHVALAESIGADDLAFSVPNERWWVVVDAASFPYLKGLTIDYQGEGLSRRLTYHNPNVSESCGCGESFALPATGA